jgi:tetrapyrrole methylase family protein / MazG family protein
MGGEILVVGMGPGPVGYLTEEAKEILVGADEIYFRLSGHPVYNWLREQDKQCVSFDSLYTQPNIQYNQVYQTIIKTLIKAADKYGRVVYALPGNPYVFEKTPRRLREAEGGDKVTIKVIAGISFLETLYIDLGYDPEEGLQILNAMGFLVYGDYPFTEELPLLIGQIGLPGEMNPGGENSNAGAVHKALLNKFPGNHEVTLIWSTGMPDYKNKIEKFALKDLPEKSGYVKELATLFVPAIRPPWETAKKAQS